MGKLVSDNEPILCADAWVEVHKKLGTNYKHISAYNAKANGAAEVMVKQLKGMLGSFERQGIKWWRALPACEKAYNDSVHSVTGYTPFFLNFGRHPLPDLQSLLTEEEDRGIQEFVHKVQAELSEAQEDTADKLIQQSIRTTAKRNSTRSATLEYKVGDYVYLETSQFKKTPILAPFRSGPYAVTKVVAGGNAVFLEGFRHPFNVELITPTLRYANGITPHLTKHVLETNEIEPAVQAQGGPGTVHDAGVGVTDGFPEDEMLDTGTANTWAGGHPDNQPKEPAEAADLNTNLDLQVEITGIASPGEELAQDEALGMAQGVEDAVQEFLEDSEEAWEFNPVVRIVPSSSKDDSSPVNQTQGSIVRRIPEVASVDHDIGIAVAPLPATPSITVTSALEAPIVVIKDHVILPDQLPGNICKVLTKSGNTLNSSRLHCLCDNGIQCSISYRHLVTLVGKEEVNKLLATLEWERV